MNKTAEALCRRLAYSFNDPTLLTRALTHRSKSADHNERLEFLGDSVLNVVISDDLYDRFPHLAEGELTRLRASLVRQPTLASHARGLDIGSVIELGGGELKSGGFDRDSILADTLEAVIGAVFKDGGFDQAARVVRSLYRDSLARLDPNDIPKDPKTQLQEYLQRHALPTPSYTVLEISGEPHNQNFVVECRVSGLSRTITG
ncbi:MAG TPA: ribonuclease III, partial [Burkholderiales bacterium]|nr:ribonuclease III [Burkholderiales bacterium]